METGCERCGGNHYVTYAEGELARARVCECAAACEKCGGDGYQHVENERGYVFAVKCDCQSLITRVERFNDARLPALFHNKLLEGYKRLGGNQQEVYYHGFRFRKEFSEGERGILYWGGPGVGKTHLMSAMIRYFTLETGLRCRFVDFFHLVSDLYRQWKEGGSGASLVSPLTEVPVLAIDELGKRRASDWSLDVLDEIISKRYNRRLTTFFTTNLLVDTKNAQSPVPEGPVNELVMETLDERVGPRVTSRIMEMFAVINVYGPDYRTQQAGGYR